MGVLVFGGVSFLGWKRVLFWSLGGGGLVGCGSCWKGELWWAHEVGVGVSAVREACRNPCSFEKLKMLFFGRILVVCLFGNLVFVFVF